MRKRINSTYKNLRENSFFFFFFFFLLSQLFLNIIECKLLNLRDSTFKWRTPNLQPKYVLVLSILLHSDISEMQGWGYRMTCHKGKKDRVWKDRVIMPSWCDNGQKKVRQKRKKRKKKWISHGKSIMSTIKIQGYLPVSIYTKLPKGIYSYIEKIN